MFDVNNRKFVFVAGNIARSTGITKIGQIAAGEVVLAKENGDIILSNTTYTTLKDVPVQIVQKTTAGKMIKSPLLRYSGLKNYSVSVYAADTTPITYIGYIGSGTATLETPLYGKNYSLRIRREHIISGEYDYYNNNKTVTWSSAYNGSATEWAAIHEGTRRANLAIGLYEALVNNYNNEIDGYFTPELICNITSGNANAPGGATAGIFTQYSKTVVFTGSTLTGVAAGAYLRVGSEDGVTYPVYKVESFTAATNTVVLTTPFMGTTATVGVASLGVLTLGTSTPDLWGIKLTGNSKYFQVGRFGYDLFNFVIWTAGFDDTDIYESAKAVKGNGTYNEVATAEWEAYQAGTNQFFEHDMPPRSTPLEAITTGKYNITSLQGYNETDMFVQSKHQNYYNIIIATLNTAAGFTNGGQQGVHSNSTDPAGVITAIDKWVYGNTGTDPNKDATSGL